MPCGTNGSRARRAVPAWRARSQTIRAPVLAKRSAWACVTTGGGAFAGLNSQYSSAKCYVKPAAIVGVQVDITVDNLEEMLVVKDALTALSTDSSDFVFILEQKIGYGAYAALVDATPAQVFAIANLDPTAILYSNSYSTSTGT